MMTVRLNTLEVSSFFEVESSCIFILDPVEEERVDIEMVAKKHIKGSWKKEGNKKIHGIQDDVPLATGHFAKGSTREQEVMAILIAKAPELLSVLRKMVDDYGFNRSDDARGETIAEAKAILAKIPY